LPALGNSQAIQGSSQSLKSFDLLVLTNETHAIMSMNASKPMSEVGYLSIGFGQQMSDSLMLVAWPNADQTWFVSVPLVFPPLCCVVVLTSEPGQIRTISQREASGHVMPKQDSGTSAFQVVDRLSTNSSTANMPYTVLTVMRPLDLSTVQGFSATSKNVQLQRAPRTSDN
jgi:hypothetical protein